MSTLLQHHHHTAMRAVTYSQPFYVLVCAQKHPYRHVIQRDVARLKRAMYPSLNKKCAPSLLYIYECVFRFY